MRPDSPRPRVVLDTDTYNEVDDQFALAHLLLSPEQVDLEAVYAAPFTNERSTGPGDGMEKSFLEIERVQELVGAKPVPSYRGSTQYLPGARTPVESEAARNLVERAMSGKAGKLYVLAIGACTNVASALLMEPKIAEKIVVVWLGGHALHWSDTKEFNLIQDLHGSRVLFDDPVPLVLLPCMGVTSHLIITVPELEKFLAPYSRLGKYLTDIVRGYFDNSPGWSKVIWDIAASAWAINPDWTKLIERPSPILNDDVTWSRDESRRKIYVAESFERNHIFADFYAKAKAHG